MQPRLTGTFLASTQWGELSPLAQSVLRGVLGLAIGRDGEWYIDATHKELADWFGSELRVKSAEVFAGLRELEQSGCFRKSRSGFMSRFVLARSILTT